MHQDLITPLFFPTRLQKFPCYGQKFLSEHPEIWFNGITSYLGNGGINSDEFSIILDSPADHSDYPLKDDTHLFFISQRNEHLQHIYGWHFYKIFVKPSAICIRSHFKTNFDKRADRSLRSFVVVAGNTERDKKVIGEFSYNDALAKSRSGAIFFLNTDNYYNRIYIQQTEVNFGRTNEFLIERIEIHGEIHRILAD